VSTAFFRLANEILTLGFAGEYGVFPACQRFYVTAAHRSK